MIGTIQRESIITCPVCGHQGPMSMLERSRVLVGICPVCGAKLTPGPDGCCVPCVYGTVPCPPVQRARIGAKEA